MFNQDLVSRYQDIIWDDLLKKDMGGYSLEEVNTVFIKIKNLFDTILANSDKNEISPSLESVVNSQLSSFLDFCAQIIGNYVNTAERQSWIDRVKQKYAEVYDTLGKEYLLIKIDDSNRQRILDENIKRAEEMLLDIRSKSKTIDGLSEHIKKRASEEEISSFGQFFKETAKTNKIASRFALGGIFFSVVMTGFLATIYVGSYAYSSQENSTLLQSVLISIYTQNLLVKVILLSLGGFAISHFSKVYSAEKHLFVLNTQRQNALDSHRQILNSVQKTDNRSDLETSNAILLQVTKAIFDLQTTGYLKEGTNPMPTNQILEITKTLNK